MNFQTINFKKTVGIIEGFTKFFYGLSILGLVTSTIAVITIQFLPKDMFITNNTTQHLELSKFITYNYSINESLSIKPLITSILISVIIGSVLFAVILRQLYKVLGNVKKDKIFASENGKKIAIIGYVIIISSFIGSLAQFYVSLTIMNIINDPNININLTGFNFQMLFVGFLIVILAKIFNYGTFLQQEYDSTI